ncbi:hypothetical protein [Maricaulis sp. MIT060901]|uniref:hypothetical protein n=1 Tax=Maricaulis sp. MIT060901 TaxID=3096993 RepID=UPI003999A83A
MLNWLDQKIDNIVRDRVPPTLVEPTPLDAHVSATFKFVKPYYRFALFLFGFQLIGSLMARSTFSLADLLWFWAAGLALGGSLASALATAFVRPTHKHHESREGDPLIIIGGWNEASNLAAARRLFHAGIAGAVGMGAIAFVLALCGLVAAFS